METQPKATNINHEVGDIVIIRNKLYSHHFEIGTPVKIVSKDDEDNDYYCEDNRGNSWWCADANFII